MLEIFLANLKFAIRNELDAWIGGGLFTTQELEAVLREIQTLRENQK